MDYGDTEFREYLELARPQRFTVTAATNDTRGMAAPLNRMAKIDAHRCEVVGFMGDDHIPRTEGWQQRILDHVRAHPLAVVYGDDTIHGRNLPTAVFMDAQIVRTLGYMVPPDARHLFLDNFWKVLGEELGTLHYDPEMTIEHLHPIAGKADWDDNYAAVNADPIWQHDKAVFEAWYAERETHLAPLRRLQRFLALEDA